MRASVCVCFFDFFPPKHIHLSLFQQHLFMIISTSLYLYLYILNMHISGFFLFFYHHFHLFTSVYVCVCVCLCGINCRFVNEQNKNVCFPFFAHMRAAVAVVTTQFFFLFCIFTAGGGLIHSFSVGRDNTAAYYCLHLYALTNE